MYIRPSRPEQHLVSAAIFKKTFQAVLAGLVEADRIVNPKKARSAFLVSHLRIGSGEFGILEQRRSAVESLAPSVELFQRCAEGVYRSDYDLALEFPKLGQKIVALGRSLESDYVTEATFGNGAVIPIDTFFTQQAERLRNALNPRHEKPPYFIGNAFDTFDGRLGEIDYRGAVWTGRLVLGGSDFEIECVFDKSQGEDSLNQFGNKRVSVTGRAIYTGDSQLPERIEVTRIEEVPAATRSINIQGTLQGPPGWGRA